MMTPLRTPAFAALLLAAPLALTACQTKIDGAKLEEKITEQLKSAHAPFKSVSCPRDRAAKKDDKFTCTITLEDGGTVDAAITQTDGKGNVYLEPFEIPAH